MEKQLGKISKVKFGKGGYQDAFMALNLTFEFKGSGVQTSVVGGWAIPRSDYAKWTEADRVKAHGEMVVKISEILEKAKVDDVANLQGIPIEATFDGLMLKDWRVLEEVL